MKKPVIKGMLEARQKERDKHRSFNAAVVVSGAEKVRLLSEGHQVIPSKWVDTIKNIHEINSPNFKPIYKARLVSCGNFESVNVSTRRRFAATARRRSHCHIWCCVAMLLRASFDCEQRISRTPILSGGSNDEVTADGPASRRIDNSMPRSLRMRR